MEGVGGVACPRNCISSELVRQKKEFSDDYNDEKLGPRLLLMLKEGSRSSSAELLSTLRQLRDSLVGDEKAKASALELGVVEDLLSLLDAAAAAAATAAGAGDTYEKILLQAVGIFCILSSSAAPKNGAEACLAPNSTSPRIAEHIARALEYPSERLTAAALRAITSLYCSSLLAGSSGGAGGGGRHCCDCTAETLSAAGAAPLLRKVSARILDEVMSTAGDSWTEAAKILGVQALAALARDGDLARSLVPGVCSKGAALLGPILPAREHRGPSRAAASRTEAMRAVTTPLVLELLLNLSRSNPTAVTAWLTSCAPDWSTWGALKGLEVELNNRNEKVRIMAGLILVTCFISIETGTDPPPQAHASGVSWKPALDEVVAHRVLPLFFRTLRSWASSHETATAAFSANGSPTVSFSATSSADSFAAACGGGGGGGGGGYAAAVCSSVTAMMELASLRWQREAVAYGAVDALTGFLRRARSATPAAVSSGYGVGTQQAKKPYNTSTSRNSREDTPCAAAAGAAAATAAALRALATLCSRCEPARERIVAVGFHSAIAHWLVGGSGGGGSGGGGGGGGSGGVGGGGVGVRGGGESDDGGPVQQAALLLVRNLGRSSVPCSALVGFKVHESILGVLSRLEEAGERRRVEATVTLASSGLANMALSHEVVKQAIAGSECLHGVCKSAVDASSEKSVRMASIAVLKGTCYAASLPVRVKVAYCLGGVNGMLGLIQGPRDGAVLQGLQTLRYLLREVPLWALCRFEWQVSEADRAAATAASPSSAGCTASAAAAAAGAAAAAAPTAAAAAPTAAAAAPTAAAAAAPTAVPPAAASAAAGGQGGSPGIFSEQPAVSGDAYFIPAGAGDARLGRSEYRAERSRAGNPRLVRHFWGDITPSVGSDGRHGGGSGGIDDSRPEPMEVEFQQGGRFDSGATAAAAAVERGVERHVASMLPRKGAVVLGLERLIEAVLGKLEGAGTGQSCDDTSCAALRLLHVLSAADDSQRAALRTPRVLRLTLPYLMCDAMGPQQQQHQQHQQQQCPLGNQQPIVHEPAGWAARAGTPCVGAPDCPRHHHSSSRKTTPPYRSADLAARLLLEQLVPQRPGDNSITSPYSAFSATGGIAAGTLTSIVAARARAAAGGRGFRTSVGSWCAGLEFDHAGGGGVRRTEGE